MRIVFVSHDGDCTGGAQKCLIDLVKGINRVYPGYEIYMLFPKEGSMVKECLPYIRGYRIVKSLWWLTSSDKKATLGKRLSFLWRSTKYFVQTYSVLKEIAPDYVITNTLAVPTAAFAAKLLKLKHIWFVHEVPSEAWSARFLFKEDLVFKYVDRLSERIVVTSNYALTYYKIFIDAVEKLQRVYQAVEVSRSPEAYVRTDFRYTLVQIGSFDPNKDQLELLRAIKAEVDSGKEIHCYLVGATDNEYTAQVRSYVSGNKLDNQVTIVDFCENPAVYYYLSDVAVICSRSEAFGRVTVEAQKCGLPVIASLAGANTELVKVGVNGFLYRKGDLADLVAKIELFRDSQLRERMRENNNPEIDNQYTCEGFAAEFCGLLNE